MFIDTPTHTCTHIHTYVHMNTITYMSTYTHAPTHACTYIHTNMHAHTHTYIPTHACTYMLTCPYVGQPSVAFFLPQVILSNIPLLLSGEGLLAFRVSVVSARDSQLIRDSVSMNKHAKS